ncbi:hypothetical protein GCM10023231_15720 [Olivibacter ginsenosidimutans]|uniref:Uncharacterized protein n=1 Tax=Olivibacter ginsenosidimutans TaxID=1176537 RepID=A0ABP9AZE4_9SPHI
MDKKLKTLIRWYEKEEKQLGLQLKQALNENDFLAAHYNQLALYRLQNTLEIHKMLADPLFIQKNAIRQWINLYKNLPKNYPGARQYFQKRINKLKQELRELEQKKEIVSLSADNAFERAIIAIIEKKVKRAILILDKAKNVSLTFFLSDRKLLITLENTQQLYDQYVISDKTISSLKKLGFQSTNNEDLCLSYILNDNFNCYQLKITLSQIIFDVFHYLHISDEKEMMLQEIAN